MRPSRDIWGRDAQRWRRADPPAREGRDRLGRQMPELINPSAAADHQRGHAALLRRQLQAPALREIERRQFRHHGDEAGAAQRFLHRPEHIVIALHTEMQQLVGIKAPFRQGAGIKIAPPCDPQSAAAAAADVMLPATDQVCDGSGGKTRFLQIRSVARKLMQGTQRQAAARQMPVDRGKAPSEIPGGADYPRLFQLRDLPPQGSEHRRRRRQGGGKSGPGQSAIILHIPFLFLFCRESRNENI